MTNQQKISNAIRAARMYYYQHLTTAVIAKEMKVSRSTVSRLLSFARETGLVDIRIIEPTEMPDKLAQSLIERYGIENVHVVPVPEIASEADSLERVALYTANYLNTIFDSDMILGIAWGTTLTAVSKHLLRKNTHNSHVVQLNGAGNTQSMGIGYASQIIMRFSENYSARAHLFPVPTFFDYAETKQALWREGSVKRILDLQAQADLLLYSIGAVNAGIPSHVYSAGFLTDADYKALDQYRIVGDIATVFFKEDGSSGNIPMNKRASGPDLSTFREKHAICVVSGLAKVRGLHAALTGKLMSELIIDEPTARALIEDFSPR